MPFGHKNCVAAWQRIVDQALAGLDFAVAFADDVLIFSHDDEQEHMRRVRIVFDRLKAPGVQVSPPKTALGLSRVNFLGHIVSGAGVEPMADKAEAINSLPAPKNVSDVDDNGVEYAVSFASRMNTPVEADLSSYEGEVGAVVWVVQRFRYYMYGYHFQLITDCKAMGWLRTTARLRGKLARCSLILAEYDFSIKHRPGKDNTVPDLLSRRPMPSGPVRATSDAAGITTPIATQRRSPVTLANASAMFGGCTPSNSVAISYMRGETTPADVSVEVWQQLVRRCAKYSLHNDKVIVIAEHFSKWIELVHVRDLEASTTAKALHERVLARHGAPVEVVTDNCIECQGAFREQLERHGIQPVDIPPGHPQASGMADRIVQVLKVALRKVVPTLGTASWHFLFGRDHVAPDQVCALLEEPVDMDNDIAVINPITQ
eukprot:jgi/Tetstr1/463647/TSEL_008508.t1